MNKLVSIIIACGNGKKYLNLILFNILNIIEFFDNFDIIVSDDSNDFVNKSDFYNYIKAFNNMDIKYYKNNTKVHCPGNTRLNGLNHATGEWILFIDDDDLLSKKGIYEVINLLKSNNITEQTVKILAKFLKFDSKTHKSLTDVKSGGWLHGSLYRNSFIKLHQISFIPDMRGNEDIYFNTRFYEKQVLNDKNTIMMNIVVYKMMHSGSSITVKKENDLSYNERYLGDYLYGSILPIIDLFNADNKKYYNLTLDKIICSFIVGYYQCQFFKSNNLPMYNQVTGVKTLAYYIKKVLELYKLTINELVRLIKEKDDVISFLRADTYLFGDYYEVDTIDEFFILLSEINI